MSRLSRIKIKGISDDSRTCKRGDIFFAIHGPKVNGCAFIEEAVKKGAFAVVTGKKFKGRIKGIKVIRVSDPRIELSKAASNFYKDPSKKIKVIGVTGTNGKTTITYLISDIFKKAGFETGIIGTICHKWKGKAIEAKNTTPGALELQRLLSRMNSDKVDYCAMEVSSHSLDQERVAGIDFRSAIFTNITGEHLDYHKTFANYIRAKVKLFRTLNRRSQAILNADDENFKKIKEGIAAPIVTYGIRNKADIRADDIKTGMAGMQFMLRAEAGSLKIESPLIGIFNIYNILAAAAAAMREGIPLAAIQGAVMDFKGAEGRLERVDEEGDFKVFVDYAHTDNALENVLGALRPTCANRLIVVFGCGGDRDTSKRPRMGNVASRLADFSIVTSDNPRSELPSAITKEIEKGMDRKSGNYKVMLDRKSAINEAISMAQTGDVVLIAGKGHERYQIVGDKILPFSDTETARQVLRGQKKCLVRV
ncbi:MAG: UDP-N-acetylmuramoyl-L-alanyl-D-glutamate--2,6-diaminopimelate ligase [Candidatus Omnitrophica bacterium]|nr:UDP-N-acetylmuramoyl-L-alanyl-D-glutamate--2,6-diaminopimelate ligase [Candidatus Omnitrophota bacterium]